MSNAVCIALIVAVTFLLFAMPLMAAWVYRQGTLRASPIPKFSNPFAKPDAAAPPANEPNPPLFGCPRCSSKSISGPVRDWKAKPGGWECGSCHFYLRHTTGSLSNGAPQGVL